MLRNDYKSLRQRGSTEKTDDSLLLPGQGQQHFGSAIGCLKPGGRIA
jgi:hypothetical protein